MGVRFPSVATTTLSTLLPANANETVILVAPPLNISLDFAQIVLQWFTSIIAGTGTTAFVFRIRRGVGVTGAIVGLTTWTDNVVVGSSTLSSGVYVDTPGAVGGQQYSLTISQTGATAAGTYNDGCFLAFAL